MTLSRQLESQRKSKGAGSKKMVKKKDEPPSSPPSDESRSPTPEEEKPGFLRKTITSLMRNIPLRRSFNVGKDPKAQIKRRSFTSSLTSLWEDQTDSEASPVQLTRKVPVVDEVTTGMRLHRTQSFHLPTQREYDNMQALQEQKRRAASHSSIPAAASLQYVEGLSASVISLPGLLSQEHETPAPTRYQRQKSSDSGTRANGTSSKVKKHPAHKLESGVGSGRSRSLNHIDALDAMEPDAAAFHLSVPPPSDAAARRHKLARSQVSSSEYFSVTFELGDEVIPDEFVPATKGVSLADALNSVLLRSGVDVEGLVAYLDSCPNAYPLLAVDTGQLGGKNVRVAVKGEKALGRSSKPSSSQPPSRKNTVGNYRGKKNTFFSASTEEGYDAAHDARGAKASKKRLSALFGNNKDTKMQTLSDLLDSYSKYGIPQMAHSAQDPDDNDEDLYKVEETWQELVGRPEELSERLCQQQTAIWELVQTEAAYIRTLKVVTDLFLSCLVALQSNGLLLEVDKQRLFSNIPDICAANRRFWRRHLLPMVDDARRHQRPLDPAFLLSGFLLFEEVFSPYTQYCAQQMTCQQYCRDQQQEDELFTAYLVWCETQRDCNRLGLIDILVKPMQRLTKYSLLLKAVLKNTDRDDQRACIERMIRSVDQFVNNVNSTLRSSQDHERLRGIIKRIESYDVVETKDDDLERLLRSYSVLDLTGPMPGCLPTQRRHLLLEADLKLKDNTSSKMDVHCFLLTDMLLVCKAAKRGSGAVRVVRQPYLVERLMAHELPQGLALVYLNEYRTATAAFILTSSEARTVKTLADGIRKAQQLYAEAKERRPAEAAPDDDAECHSCASSFGTGVARSPRESSRVSSLAHSHSGSMEMNEASSVSSVSHSRGVSVENASLSSDEGAADAAKPAPSPRSERRSALCKTPNTLSVKAPALGQSLPNLTLGSASSPPQPPSSLLLVPGRAALSPGHRGVSYPPPSPPRGSLRRALPVPQSRNPPLQKARPLPAPSLDFDVPLIAGVSPPSEEGPTPPSPGKRPGRTDNRRYHTAGAIDDIKKQDSRDASIHKRLSWNCAADARGRHLKCSSADSVHSSSGVSSTGSAAAPDLDDYPAVDHDVSALQVVTEDPLTCSMDLPPPSDHVFTTFVPGPPVDQLTLPAPETPQSSPSSRPRTPQEAPPRKGDLRRLKELVLPDASLDASNV